MREISLKPYAKNIICICADSFEGNKIKGRLYHCYSDKAIDLSDAKEMLLIADRLFDKIGLPQASTKARSFFDEKEKTEQIDGEEPVKYMEPGDVIANKGTKATFVVHVQYRQNSTWQGTVVWADKKITKNFRSALELLKLMDEAMESEDE